MARPRKQLDLRAVAEVLTDPALERASMDVVSRRLGVAKPTLYRMAGSREELIGVSIDAEAERLLEHVHRDGLRGLLLFVEDSPAGFALLFGDRYPESRLAVRRVENRLRDAVVRDEPGQAPAHPELVAAGLLALAAGVARRAIEDGALNESERLGSDFDAVAILAARILDSSP